jgi:hypothetical protein
MDAQYTTTATSSGGRDGLEICLVLVPGDAVDACCGEVKSESGPKRVLVSASATRAQA